MDDELREALSEIRDSHADALKDVRDTQKESTGEVKGLISGVSQALHQHMIESGQRWTEVDARARAAHHRMDQHLKAHEVNDDRKFQARLAGKGTLIATWVAIGTALLGTATAIALAFASKG